ncbi:MAG: hypothetical protein IKQ96_07220 [Lachnospiraceae bacterium]|nr:hypothetical protein [Lachnospiraceae bacterium]
MKNKGFTFTLVVAALMLATGLVYYLIYNGTNYLSMQAVYVLVGGAILSVLLGLVLGRFAPALQFGAVTVALCLYIYYIYFFISSAIYGIQYSGLPFEFFVNAACYVVTFLASIINCFVPHTAKEQ